MSFVLVSESSGVQLLLKVKDEEIWKGELFLRIDSIHDL